MSPQSARRARHRPGRLGKAILALMAASVLSGCGGAPPAPDPVRADQKPALAAPPASLMTPQGY